MKKKMHVRWLACIGWLLLCGTLSAQNVQLKTNLLYDATATINLGAEWAWDEHRSLDISGNYNGWKLGDRKWKHWMVQPEMRYWLTRVFDGHYLGVHLHGGQLNVGHLPFGGYSWQNYYKQGWFYGAGISYGYQWNIGKRWKMETGLGLGYARFDYDEYGCPICGGKLKEDARNYWGVTKVNLSLIYVLPSSSATRR